MTCLDPRIVPCICADVDDGFAVTGLFVEGDVLDASLLKKKDPRTTQNYDEGKTSLLMNGHKKKWAV
jgi:hypothetical protein